MNRLMLFFSVVLLLCLPVWAGATTQTKSVTLVSRGYLELTAGYVRQAFTGDERKRQDAVISHPKRFHQYIENRWIELNLIDQFKRGAVPDNMPALDQIMTLIEQTTLAKLMIERLAEQQGKGLDATAQTMYQQNLSRYQQPERVKAAHILVKTDQRSDQEAHKLAEQIRAEAISDQTAFADLVLKYSEDPSAQNNHGDLGYFTRGQMAKPFEDAAFSMHKLGEISPVVKTQFGYHIIRFENRQKASIQPFSSVRDSIKEELLTQRRQSIWKQYQNKVATISDKLVNHDEVITWLWFAGMAVMDESNPVWKETVTKLSMAKLLSREAVKTKYDQRPDIKQKVERAKRKAMVKLRRKALYDEIARRDLSTAVKERYLVNKKLYVVPEQADLSVIFLSGKQRSVESLATLAKSVYQQAKKVDTDFEQVALRYSDAVDVKNNKGHLGFKKPGELGKQLDALIFAKKQSGLLAPVKTPDGIVIVKVHAFRPPRQRSLDEVKDVIKAKIVNDLASQEYALLVQSIVNHPDNKVNDEAVDQLYVEIRQSR